MFLDSNSALGNNLFVEYSHRNFRSKGTLFAVQFFKEHATFLFTKIASF